MKLWLKIFLIISSVISLLCLTACAAGFFSGGYETVVYSPGEGFSDVRLELDTADLELRLSEDGKCRVECDERKRLAYSVGVSDGELLVRLVDSRRWYDHLYLSFGKGPRVTVYLPEAVLGDLSVECDTGDVRIPAELSFERIGVRLATGDVECLAENVGAVEVEATTGNVALDGTNAAEVSVETTTGNITVSRLSVGGELKLRADTGIIAVAESNALSLDAKTTTGDMIVADSSFLGEVKIEVTTGDTEFSRVTAGSLTTRGDTGDVTLASASISGKMTVERTTGDVRLAGCDAAEVTINTTTGDVEGSFMSDKIIFATSDTGSIDIPRLTSGGRCDISTSTGDIRIEIE